MNDTLYHHGVKGMKWGIRRSRDRHINDRGVAAEYNENNEDIESEFSKDREVTEKASLRFSRLSNTPVDSPTAKRMSKKGKEYLQKSNAYEKIKNKKTSSITLRSVIQAGIALIRRLFKKR